MKRERITSKAERLQRGCEFCEDATHSGWMCPYAFCPYTEMDGFTKYQDWLKATGGDSVRKLLKRRMPDHE